MATLTEELDAIKKRLETLENKAKSTDTKNTESGVKPFSVGTSIDIAKSVKAISMQRRMGSSSGLFDDGSINTTTHKNKKNIVWDSTNTCWKFYAVYYTDSQDE